MQRSLVRATDNNYEFDDWELLIENKLVQIENINNDHCNIDCIAKYEFPVSHNIGSNINHLLALKIPIPISLLKRLIQTGETDYLDKVLEIMKNRLTNYDIEILLEFTRDINSQVENYILFDRTIYRETLDVLNKHRATQLY